MPLELDFEAAARKFCMLRKLNPNILTNYVSPDGLHTNPHQVPMWRNVEERMRYHQHMHDAMNGSYVMMKELGAVPPETPPDPNDFM